MDLAAEELEGHGFLTGYFRDGQRRIDLVLVAKETMNKKVEKIKKDFLANVLNMGMEMEIEGGLGKSVRDLVFIKIHATDRVIKHFGFFYNMKKYFKKSHVEFVGSHSIYEKELIKTIRRWYPGPGNYSTIERSTIVYKALLSCPFGKPFNHVGINQLIHQKVFLDVYPLHDGPLKLTLGQTPLELTGRQALYYSWSPMNNVFKGNPSHLIREYCGERVAFLFSFYQFYNRWLFILAVVGTALFVSNYYVKQDNLNRNTINETNRNYPYPSAPAYDELPVCPRCADFVGCPFRNFKDYISELLIRIFLANPYNFVLPFFVCIWGILFYIFWKRKQNYLNLMWECNDDDAKVLVRPEYRDVELPPTAPQQVPVTVKGDKILKPRHDAGAVGWQKKRLTERRWFKDLAEFIILMLVLSFIFFVYFPVMVTVNNKLRNRMHYLASCMKVNRRLEQITHTVIDVIGSVNAVVILVLEHVWFKMSHWLVRFANPRTEFMHEEKHSLNLFGVSLLIHVVMLCYYAFLKGALYTTPHNKDAWKTPLGLGIDNCGMLSCIDEPFILFVAIYKTKTCIEDVYRMFEKPPHDRPPQGSWCARGRRAARAHLSPCWEREFHLKPLDELFFWKNLNQILLQYAAVTFFMTCFQLGPLFAFIWNIWHQNYLANMVLKHHRRPLMTQTWGLGGWEQIVLALPYLACFFNSMFMAKHNTIMHTLFWKRYWKTDPNDANTKTKLSSGTIDRRFFADYYMGFFDVFKDKERTFHEQALKHPGDVPHFCLFPAQINRLTAFVTPTPTEPYHEYMPMAGFYYILWHQALLLLIPMLMMLLVTGLIHMMLSTKSRMVEELEFVEDSVKNYDITKEMAGGGRFDRRRSDLPPAGAAGDTAATAPTARTPRASPASPGPRLRPQPTSKAI